jgi:hypothetical protein
LLKSPALLLASALVVTLLASPYLYNYDFILLLVPFAILINPGRDFINHIIVIACYLVPTVVIASLGRAGNIALIIVTIPIAFLLYLRVKESSIDVPAHAA